MPWEHCGQTLGDDEPCSACGATKAQWTVEFDVTRTFKVSAGGRRLALALVNREDLPVALEPFTVLAPDEVTCEGALDDLGNTTVSCGASGRCVVTFPYWEQGEVVRLADDEDDGAPAGASGGAGRAEASARAEPVERPARFEVETRSRRHRFRVTVPYLDVALVDRAGAVVPDRPFELRSGEDVVLSGAVGPRGWARVRGLADGEYGLVLPELDRAAWARADEAPAEGGEGAG